MPGLVKDLSLRGMMLKSLLCAAALLIPGLTTVSADQAAHANAEAAAIAEFKKGVNAYVHLRDKVDSGAAAAAETVTPAKIAGAQEVLAQRIRAARADAKPGVIFRPEIKRVFLALLRPELKGKQGARTKDTINDENPGKI